MPLIRLEMQRRGLDAGRVRDHAVGGDDDMGLDAKRADHPDSVIRGCPS